ncbi:MAG: hypothetical protein VKN56_07605 [Cyanobacteriota bacterium]|nr:hypothetical protein [Cyanobacteriota bacterium]
MDSDFAHRDGEDIIKLRNREASLQLDRERRCFFQVNYCRFPILAGRLPFWRTCAIAVTAAGAVVFSADQANAALSLVTSRTVLNGIDFIDWAQLGAPFTNVPNPFTATSNLGDQVNVSMAAPGTFLRLNQSTGGWNGNFAPGDALIWTQYFTNDLNPITLIGFNGPGIYSGGAQIQPDFYGSYIARIEAFDATNTSMGVFTVNGVASGASNNSASFIGVTSDTPISSLSLSVLSATNNRADFAINRFDFNPVPGPLPALGACAAFGFSRKLRGRINAANLN